MTILLPNNNNNLSDGLILDIPLDGISGCVDRISGRRLTHTGLTSQSSLLGEGLLFGASAYITGPSDLVNLNDTQPFSIAWEQIPLGSTAYNTVLGFKGPSAAYGFVIYQATTDGGYYFTVGPQRFSHGANFGVPIGPTTNGKLDKYLLVVTKGMAINDYTSYILYRNGVEVKSTAIVDFAFDSTNYFTIGGLRSGGDWFEGVLKNIRIWNRIVSKDEAVALTYSPPLRHFEPIPTLAPTGNKYISIPAGSTPMGSASAFNYDIPLGLAVLPIRSIYNPIYEAKEILWHPKITNLSVGGGTPTIKVNNSEVVLNGNGSSWFTIPSTTFNPVSNGMTIVFRAGYTTSNASMLCGDTSNTSSFLWFNNNSNAVQIRLNGTDIVFTTNNSQTSINTFAIVIPKGSSSVMKLFKNGGLIHTTGLSTSGTFTINAIGNGYTGSSLALNGCLSFLHIVEKEISDDLAKEYSLSISNILDSVTKMQLKPTLAAVGTKYVSDSVSAFNHDVPLRPAVIKKNANSAPPSKWLRIYGPTGQQFASGNPLKLESGVISNSYGESVFSARNSNNIFTSNEMIPGITDKLTVVFMVAKIGNMVNASDFLFGEHIAAGGAYNYGIYHARSLDTLYFYITATTTTVYSIGIPVGEYINGEPPSVYTFTFDGRYLSSYKNGKIRDYADIGSNVSLQRNSSAILRSGYWNSGIAQFNFHGAAISNTCLSPNEISEKLSSYEEANRYLGINTYSKAIPFPQPRPFIKTTRKSKDTSNSLDNLLIGISGSNEVKDVSYNNIVPTRSNGTIGYFTGVNGPYIKFDAATDVSFSHPAMQTFSLAAWVLVTSTDGQRDADEYQSLISRGAVFENSTNFAFGLRALSTGGVRRAFVYGRSAAGTLLGTEGPSVNGSSEAHLNVWNRIVATWQWGSQKLYINGVLVNSATGVTETTGIQPIRIGGPNSLGSTDRRFPFGAKDIRIYKDRILTPQEIMEDYLAGPNGYLNDYKNFRSSDTSVTTDDGIIVPPYLSNPQAINLTSTTATPKVRVDY